MDHPLFGQIRICPHALLFPEIGSKYFVVYSEDDDHSHAAGDHSGDDAADRVAHGLVGDKRNGDRIPHAGKQVHHQEHHDGGEEVQHELGRQRAVTLEGYISLQREVDALAEENGGQVGQREGQAAIDQVSAVRTDLQGVADDGQLEADSKQLHRDTGEQPLRIAHEAVEQTGPGRSWRSTFDTERRS